MANIQFPTKTLDFPAIQTLTLSIWARVIQLPTFLYFCRMIKVGILGGGQLGRMLLQAAANYEVETYVMDADETCPAAHLCRFFIKGDIRDYESVYRFGQHLQVMTIEIENVNVEALEKLESEGVKIIPKPSVLRIINNKILQKQFYVSHDIPTAEFAILESKKNIGLHPQLIPGVQKLAIGGYD